MRGKNFDFLHVLSSALSFSGYDLGINSRACSFYKARQSYYLELERRNLCKESTVLEA